MEDLVSFLAEFLVFVVRTAFLFFIIQFIGSLIYLFFKDKVNKARAIENAIVERLNNIVHCVKVETHQDMIYWFDHDNNEFLAQGRTTEDVIAALKFRFSDHIFVIDNKYMFTGPKFEKTEVTAENMAKVFSK